MAELITLHTAWDVDRHIVLDSAEKLVLVRFSSYTSLSEEAEDHLGASSGFTGQTSLTNRKRARDDDNETNNFNTNKMGSNNNNSTITTSSTVASLLLNNVDEHYLRTRQMDALLQEMAPKVRKYCTIYLVDTREVTAFNEMYELGHDRDPFAIMFFYRNRHIRVDVGTGNNNKVNFFAFEDLYDFLPIVDAAYKAGKQGRSITSCDKKFTTVALRR